MTTREQLEAEAEELYPITKALDVDHTAIVIARRSAHVRAKTISAEQVEAAAAMLWVVCSVRDCRAWVQLTDAMQETFRDDARAAFRAAGFYMMEGDDE